MLRSARSNKPPNITDQLRFPFFQDDDIYVLQFKIDGSIDTVVINNNSYKVKNILANDINFMITRIHIDNNELRDEFNLTCNRPDEFEFEDDYLYLKFLHLEGY